MKGLEKKKVIFCYYHILDPLKNISHISQLLYVFPLKEKMWDMLINEFGYPPFPFPLFVSIYERDIQLDTNNILLPPFKIDAAVIYYADVNTLLWSLISLIIHNKTTSYILTFVFMY